MNDLGLAETVDRLGESIVITVADAAHRRLGGNCSSRAEPNRNELPRGELSVQ